MNISSNQIVAVQVGEQEIPTDQFGRYQLNYNGTRNAYQVVSMIDVMDGKVGREILKDKIVLVGAWTTGIGDIVATPFDPVLPGVALHANVIDNILHHRYLIRNHTTNS